VDERSILGPAALLPRDGRRAGAENAGSRPMMERLAAVLALTASAVMPASAQVERPRPPVERLRPPAVEVTPGRKPAIYYAPCETVQRDGPGGDLVSSLQWVCVRTQQCRTAAGPITKVCTEWGKRPGLV
jgi:hypothetical protein